MRDYKDRLVTPPRWVTSPTSQGGYSEFQMKGMIDWGKNENPTKIPGPQTNPRKSLDQNVMPKKSHAEFPSHKNFQKALK